MAFIPRERKSLLSSQARVQAPWVKVQIGNYTFGVFNKKEKENTKNDQGFYIEHDVQYPNYVQRLNITKINGQINQYVLYINYPIRPQDDPNFFEKVFSSVSKTRKIIFSYGDSSMPAYCYKNEEAIITKVTQQFDLQNSKISYVVYATSTAILGRVGNFTFVAPGYPVQPSKVIIDMLSNTTYKLLDLFTGMNKANFDKLIARSDQMVTLQTKTNISPLDYISYLVSCMIPAGANKDSISKDIYVLTIHDDTIFDPTYNAEEAANGPYFKVTRTSYVSEQSDAYEVDIGYNTANIVTNFSIVNDENYSLLYDYSNELFPEEYTRRLDSKGQWVDIFAPTFTSGNDKFLTNANDITWYTKLTKYPISANITIMGLLRPATLMQYLRLNVIFPGGHKHISSGLYIITKQVDDISEAGYKTTLSLTKISGDNEVKTNKNQA